MTPFSRRTIGNSGFSLPVFGFGSAHLGELYNTVDEAQSMATLDAAWAAGVRYFDTAPWYGRGLAEHRLGGYLRTKPRSEWALTSKVGRILKRPKNPKTFDRSPWVGGLNFEAEFDYTYDGVMRSYEQLLQRLGVDTVDALLIHDLDSFVHAPADLEKHLGDLRKGGLRALETLKAGGEINAFGAGINTSQALEMYALEFDLDFILVAMPYTLIDQSCLNTGMAACLRRGVSVIIGSPFASGILATGSGGQAKYAYSLASPGVQAKVRAIEAVCLAHATTLQAAALQFPLAHPAVVSIIPGAARPGEITQNVASFQAPIPAAFWADLKVQRLIDAGAPTPLPH